MIKKALEVEMEDEEEGTAKDEVPVKPSDEEVR